MPVDDRSRLNLHRKLEAVLGHEEADNLMAHLPPVTWNQVATKDDLDALAALMRSDLHVVTTELRGEMRSMRESLRSEIRTTAGELRSEFHTTATELRTEIHTTGTELRTEMQVGFATLRADFVEGVNRQIKWLVAFAAAWTSVLVAAVRLIP